MDASVICPVIETAAPIGPAYDLRRPQGALSAPLVFASPHSGRLYPDEMMSASVLDADAIRRSEDVLVDALIAPATDHGATVLAARYARAFIDVNREPYELDPAMFSDELPAFVRGKTARVAAGLGAIARIVSEGQEIYGRKLTFADALRRIEMVHRPYHEALSCLVEEAKAAHGSAILIDWHSMPAAAAASAERGRGGRPCDMVLGDRFGSACGSGVTALVERELTAMGYQVARNAPYAGGYTTEFYGKPTQGVHALQIEINRALYLDEASLEPHEGFERLRADLGGLFAALAAGDWRGRI